MHAAELAAKAKAMAECEAARSSELKRLESLEANCNEMRSYRLAIKEQLDEMELKLSEMEEKNQKLAEHTNDALI